ncbi:MAG: S41 family peptidase [Ignavibacteria bacterium]|nr:S41 family peptidase [Ignavibacteria bacterium]
MNTISFLPGVSLCQQSADNILITEEIKLNAVNSVSDLLNSNYIFPETAKEMEIYIKNEFEKGSYEGINDPQKFSDMLTDDLQKVSKDKHIRVSFNPEQIQVMKSSKNKNNEEFEKKFIEDFKKENYGFKKVEILSGNIGYIDFRRFGSGELIKDKVAVVMSFVENCEALIFDMRYNGGGDPTGVQLITSYLFGDEPVHLNDLYYRPDDTLQEFWTLKDIEGKRMKNIPVFILTGSYSFSGAEEFAYNLQNLNRAVIVGETTGGGANPGNGNIVDDIFTIFIPTGRAINPYTKTNWEGTGVKPDVEINSIDALTKAHILALEKIAGSSSSEMNENKKRRINRLIESLNATLSDPDLSTEQLKKFAGDYGDRKIFYENGRLFHQRAGREKFEMTPMSKDTFMLHEIDLFRLKFENDSDGNIISLSVLFDNGKTETISKIN